MDLLKTGLGLLLIPVMLCTLGFDSLVLCHDSDGSITFEVATIDGDCLPTVETNKEGLSPAGIEPGNCIDCVDIPFRAVKQIHLSRSRRVQNYSLSSYPPQIESNIVKGQAPRGKLKPSLQIKFTSFTIDSLRSTILLI